MTNFNLKKNKILLWNGGFFIGIGTLMLVLLLIILLGIKSSADNLSYYTWYTTYNFGIHGGMNLLSSVSAITLGSLNIFFHIKNEGRTAVVLTNLLITIFIFISLGVNTVILVVNPTPYEAAHAITASAILPILLLFLVFSSYINTLSSAVGLNNVAQVNDKSIKTNNENIENNNDVTELKHNSKTNKIVTNFDTRFIILISVLIGLVSLPIIFGFIGMPSLFMFGGIGIFLGLTTLIDIGLYITILVFCILVLVKKDNTKTKLISILAIAVFSLEIFTWILLTALIGFSILGLFFSLFVSIGGLVLSILLFIWYVKGETQNKIANE